MRPITQKQIKLLHILAREAGLPIIASWAHSDLSDLSRWSFVHNSPALASNGKLSANKMWTITVQGLAFLETERAGQ